MKAGLIGPSNGECYAVQVPKSTLAR